MTHISPQEQKNIPSLRDSMSKLNVEDIEILGEKTEEKKS